MNWSGIQSRIFSQLYALIITVVFLLHASDLLAQDSASWLRSHPFLQSSLETAQQRNTRELSIGGHSRVVILDWDAHLTYSLVESSISLIDSGLVEAPSDQLMQQDLDSQRLALARLFKQVAEHHQSNSSSTIGKQLVALLSLSENFKGEALSEYETNFIRDFQASYLAARALGQGLESSNYVLGGRGKSVIQSLMERGGWGEINLQLTGLGFKEASFTYESEPYVEVLTHWELFSDKTVEGANGLRLEDILRGSLIGSANASVESLEQTMSVMGHGVNDQVRNRLAKEIVLGKADSTDQLKNGLKKRARKIPEVAEDFRNINMPPPHSRREFRESFDFCRRVIWQIPLIRSDIQFSHLF